MKTGLCGKGSIYYSIRKPNESWFREKINTSQRLKPQMKTGFCGKDQYIKALETQMKTGLGKGSIYYSALENQMKADAERIYTSQRLKIR